MVAITKAETAAPAAQTYNIQTLVEKFIAYGYNVDEYPKSTMRTRATHLRQLSSYFEGLDVRHLDMAMLNRYFVHYRETHKPSTTNTSKRIVKVFLGWLRDEMRIELLVNPDKYRSKKDTNELPKYIDRKVIDRVISRCNDQDALMIAVTYEAGLRISEMVNVRITDIHDGLHGSVITVMGKGSVERQAFISHELSNRIHRFAQKNGRCSYLFVNCDSRSTTGRMTADAARHRIQRAFREYADTYMTPHWLRHSLAVHMLQNGSDLVTIQRVLGHKGITTTMVYLRISDLIVQENYKRFTRPILA